MMGRYTLYIVIVILLEPGSSQIQLEVTPNPSTVYRDAPGGTSVAIIKAYMKDTSGSIERVSLAEGENAAYFDIVQEDLDSRKWFLLTHKAVDKPVGFVFDLKIYGYNKESRIERQVQINVIEKNLYAPSFDRTHYYFQAYRYARYTQFAIGGQMNIGSVVATDLDNQTYNSEFQYNIFDLDAVVVFQIDPKTGKIMLIADFPENVKNMTFNVTAKDTGSPPLMNHTMVTVTVSEVPAPDVFCVAVDDISPTSSVARICWKDPTNGSYVMKYELSFQLNGQVTEKMPVKVYGVQEETCTMVRGPSVQRNYTFTVRVHNGLEWSPQGVQRKVIVNKQGLYGKECSLFTNCSVWDPCKNGGECLVNPDLSHRCNCSEGWGGTNCTDVDLCANHPCENNGTCIFQGDRSYRCECPSGMFYGNFCQFYNTCISHECKNGGLCVLSKDGANYTCVCPNFYDGEHCEIMNTCLPSPCVKGRCIQSTEMNYTCECDSGFYGTYCENENTCIVKNPCVKGECRFEQITGNYTCLCPLGSRGVYCETQDSCALPYSICHNGGTCESLDSGSYVCRCTEGRWGSQCQSYDKCVEKPCLNDGICLNTSSDAFVCECQPPFYGERCERSNPCVSSPCAAGGICTNMSDTEFTCNCSVERYGKTCEKIDGCKMKRCENNATCTNATIDGDIFCNCPGLYSGKLCEQFDPCLSNPCRNGAQCVKNSSSFSCECLFGYIGNLCQYTNLCASSPCMNQGKCIVSGDYSKFRCDCLDTNFYGEVCEFYKFCNLLSTCLNNGTCSHRLMLGWKSVQVPSVLGGVLTVNISNWYSCNCAQGFYGDKCQSKSNPCYSNPCDGGHCLAIGDKYTCKEPYCREEKIITDKTGVYLWNKTHIGDSAVYPCPYGPSTYFSRGYGNRSCVLSPSGEAVWMSPNTQECKELDETEATSMLQSLMSMSGEAAFLGSDQVANITTALEELFIFSFGNVKIAEIMTNVIGNLLQANESVLLESNFKNHSSERLLWLLDEYSGRVKTNNTTHITTKNIDLHVVHLKDTKQPYTYEPQLPEPNKENKHGVRLTLPKEALAGAETDDGHRLQFITFRTSSFFIPANNAPPQDVVMKQWVVSAIVKGKPLKNLTSPIEILVKNIEDNKNHTCVFWDTEKRSWSTYGVNTVHRGANYTRCHSNHLTSFSILLDPTPGFSLPQEHEKIITFLSYIGCGISMIGLVITVLTYSMFRCLNREKSGKILLNLCTSMVLMNGAFMLGSESSKSSSGSQLCIAVAIVLHYFILSTLCWMFVEAVNMYQALIKVFSTDAGYFMLKRCIFAWGVPAVIVIIIAAVDIDNYSTKSGLCFLSHSNIIAFYAGLLGPACLILLANLVVFIMVSRVILKPKFKGQVGSSKDTLTPAQIRGAFTVMVLLGITWVFGPFAINEAKIVINYVFTILNSLQGFLIFVFRCFFNPEVRMSWVLLIKTGKFKRRKGPIKSFVSESSSSRAESRLSGSINETQKTNLYNNSVGKQKSQNILHSGQQIDHHRISRKPSKDLHSYFDDLHRYNGTDISRNGGISTIYGVNGNHAVNGINRINSRRSSGIKGDRDEYTKL